ncbi:MAG: type III pantothenate kinase [Hyphomonadaceae bacterium]|nr:type III pantothenate kinase [Hyphomonadaceae bacterium]
MLLAIDVGNTNTKFALYDGATWRGQWRVSTNSARTADEYAPWLSALMQFQGLGFTDVSAAIISTVVPQALFNLRNLIRRYMNTEPLVVGEDGVALGIALRIDNPREAGADRLVNAVGAYVAHGGPAIVIDSGTATTFDVVAADGGLEGVIIAPGINLSLQALHTAAARLPRIEIREPSDGALGKNTVHAMQSGIFYGYVELIDGLVRRLKEEQEPRLGAGMKVVATGGVASLFEGASRTIDIYDDELTSRGLLEIFRRNGGVI